MSNGISAKLPEHEIAYHSLFHVSMYRRFSLPFGSQQERREVKITALGRVSLPVAAGRRVVEALALVEPVGPVHALVLRRQELGRVHRG